MKFNKYIYANISVFYKVILFLKNRNKTLYYIYLKTKKAFFAPSNITIKK